MCEMIDLGLPSGLKWASCNIDAANPEDCGYFYAWGEVYPKVGQQQVDWGILGNYRKSVCLLETYKYAFIQDRNIDNAKFTKYCNHTNDGFNGFVDNKITLEINDDAAYQNMGDMWRIPTKADWEELLEYCTWSWSVKNNVNGYWITSKINNNSIFLPKTGRGYYWSASLDAKPIFSPNQANCLHLSDEKVIMDTCARWYVNSIRPVCLSGSIFETIIKSNKINNNIREVTCSTQTSRIFSVSECKKVMFAPGNLQYQVSTSTWRFAENQFDIIGEDNKNISPAYSGWIDLFGWGTGDNPVKESGDAEDYSRFIDWGENKIADYAPNTWRTLSYDEWCYLFFKRANAALLFGLGSVNGVNGLIILPDDYWTSLRGIAFNPSTLKGLNAPKGFGNRHYYENIIKDNFFHNTLTHTEWQQLEQCGAVFLPAAGQRSTTSSDSVLSVENVLSYGYYWASSELSSYHAYFLSFGCDYLNPLCDILRSYGQSVRLVQDV